MKNTDILSGMAKRASVRNYDNSRPVDMTTIEELLTVTMQAPTTGNMQLYSVIVTTDPENKKRLRELHFGQPMAENCSALLTFCADVRRYSEWCRINGCDAGMDNAGGMLMGIMDACIFAQQFVTAAEAAGLGTCYLGTVPYNLKAFKDELDVPEGVLPLFSISVGYPAGEAKQSDRLPLSTILHHEKFADYSTDDIKNAYAAKEALPENQEFVRINSKDNLAQVYSQIRYTPDTNRQISEALKEYLYPGLP